MNHDAAHPNGHNGPHAHDRHAGHSPAMFRDKFWLNLQQAVDLWDALHSGDARDIQGIEPAGVSG